ncbi:GAF and ANTAR domain-containing protein [Serinibacter arcticus]|uniref:ANTAR domain-containing protein n=1 Tax=Serinibacter arcticus TaxID=1655435 RepID=A0A4Z1DWM2_9MICO|nr:GAF and ANTAR domain-containing protein [Serinibacter arcticus]TGO03946.1 hypothetical protein SERN_2958 [Serinibacter arcticus]
MQAIDPFVRTTSEFSKKLLTDYDIDEVMEELAERATALLGLMGSGVGLEREGRLEVITAVPPSVGPLEERQEADQDGPCVLALTTNTIVTVPDLATEERWPAYRQVAAQLHVRSVAAVPLTLTEKAIGSFNLYRDHTGPWSQGDLAAVTALANMATAFLVNASALAQQTQLTQQLQQALETRVLLEQAKGILAEANTITVTEAFSLIRRYARNRNIKIHDVANAVVHMGVRPT